MLPRLGEGELRCGESSATDGVRQVVDVYVRMPCVEIKAEVCHGRSRVLDALLGDVERMRRQELAVGLSDSTPRSADGSGLAPCDRRASSRRD